MPGGGPPNLHVPASSSKRMSPHFLWHTFAAALPSVPEADWRALIATLAGLVSARDGAPRDAARFSYGFEVQALHRLASAAGALPTAVAEAAAAAVAEPLVWVPPELLLADGTPSLEIEQPHFDTERFLWVPAPEAAA